MVVEEYQSSIFDRRKMTEKINTTCWVFFYWKLVSHLTIWSQVVYLNEKSEDK